MELIRQALKRQLAKRWARFGRLLVATLVCSSLLVAPGHRAQGQAISAATITEIVDSNQVYIQNRAAQVNSVARQRQQVQTRAARASLRFNTGAIARLAHNSSLVVGQCAQLSQGTMLINGSLNGCSTSTVAGVRGTIYTIEVTETGETIIQVFEGEVVVERHLNPEPIDPMVEGFDPLDPTQDRMRPAFDPVVPFVNPLEPSMPPSGPPVLNEPPTGPDPTGPGLDPLTNPPSDPSFFEPSFEPSNGDPFEPPLGAHPGHLIAAAKQQKNSVSQPEPARPGIEREPEEETGEELEGETVNFTAADSIILAEGQQLIVDSEAEQAVIAPLGPEDFIRLLEGPLIRGFTIEIPGMANLRRSFQQLFPGVPLPTFWLPSVPSPRIRFPFPF